MASLRLSRLPLGAGATGMLNMWYDADIDAIMTRTAMRPIPRGKVSSVEAFVLGLALATSAVLLLAVATNLAASALLGGTILFYTAVYTAWLKRFTPQNIVIGGAAGALPRLSDGRRRPDTSAWSRWFCFSSSFSGHHRTFGRSPSMAQTTMAGQVCPCSPWFPET
jgi:UbiA prenyltransferase family